MCTSFRLNQTVLKQKMKTTSKKLNIINNYQQFPIAVVCCNYELLHCTFARFCLCAYFDKFSFEIFINGPSGCDNMDA